MYQAILQAPSRLGDVQSLARLRVAWRAAALEANAACSLPCRSRPRWAPPGRGAARGVRACMRAVGQPPCMAGQPLPSLHVRERAVARLLLPEIKLQIQPGKKR